MGYPYPNLCLCAFLGPILVWLETIGPSIRVTNSDLELEIEVEVEY